MPPARSRWRVFGHAVRITGLLAVLPLVFVLIAALTMLDRDITAPTWIKTLIAERAETVLAGGSISFGAIYLNVGYDLHPHVTLRDTVLTDAAGTTIARIAQIKGDMSPRGLILRRDVLLQNVTLAGALLNLRRARDGSVSLSFDGAADSVEQASSMVALLEQADRIFDRPALAALEGVTASGLIINFDDARAGRSWVIDNGSIHLDLRGGKTVLRSDMSLLSGRDYVTSLVLNYDSPRDSREADIGLTVTDAVAADIATQSPALSWLAGIDAPVSASLRTTLNDTGGLGPLNATLEIGQGVLQPNAATAPVRFDAAKTYLTYDPGAGRIAFTDLSVQSELGNLQASGQALLSEIRDGLPGSLVGQFQFRDIALHPPDLYPAPVHLADAQVDFRLKSNPFSVDIGQLAVQQGDMRLWAKGRLHADSDGWHTALDLRGDGAALSQWRTLWPVTDPSGARAWFAENLVGGTVSNMQVGLRQSPDAAPRILGSAEFADLRIRAIPGMPPITHASGIATYGDNRFVLVLDTAKTTPPQGGALDMAGSVMTLGDLADPMLPTELVLQARGSVTAVMSLMDQPPFGYAAQAELPVDFADGRAQVTANIWLPMRWADDDPAVQFDINARLTDLRTTYLTPGRRLAASDLDLHMDNAGMQVAGRVALGAVPMTGRWSWDYGPDSDGSSQLSAQVALSERFLDEFAITTPPGTLSGAGTGQLDVTFPASGAPSFSLTSNLAGVGLAIPAIGWAKSRNTQGAFSVSGRLGDTPEITGFAVEGGGLSAAGRITLNDQGGLDRATFDHVRVGNWLNAPIMLRGRGAQQPFGVTIRGGTLDLRQAQFGGSTGESGPLDIALDRLQVTEGIALTEFRGEFSGAGGFSGQFTGQVNNQAAIRGTVVPRNGRSAVRLVSDDAGGVARAAGFLRNAVGGSLDLTLLPTGGAGSFDGTLAIRSLRVRDAPAMAALLDAISVVGLLQQLDGQGLAFDEVDAQFRLTPHQVILAQASAVGPGLGISLDGIYTLASNQVDFQGVVSPFYLVNSIGSFLTRKGEGLIGFNFTITGNADDPAVGVNPLSALTPGMFRDIFRRPPPQVAQ